LGCLYIVFIFFIFLTSCQKDNYSCSIPPGKIIYTHAGDIYIISPDGTNRIQLTNTTEVDALSWRYTPWSSDGTKIAFERRDTTGSNKGEICIINADGTGFKYLTNDTLADMLPFWSPSNKMLSFEKHVSNTNDIFKINADGTGLLNLTNNPAWDIESAWSPLGDKIAFLSDRDTDGLYELWIMNTDGAEQKMILDLGSINNFVWSHDGSKIAVTSGYHDPSDIFIINSDGSGIANLTNCDCGDLVGDWSPDGGKIVFTSERDGNPEIYIINADGTGLMNISNNKADDWSPSWSPDGKWLTFLSNRHDSDNDDLDMYIIDISGKRELRLTQEGANRPFWSPK
jgi:Tol biopolymer transport system component